MAENVTVKISTEQLAQASGDIAGKVNALKAAFEAMTEAMNRTDSYWLGEAGEAHRSAYRKMQPHQQEALKRLEEQSQDLAKIAGVWEETEQQIKELNVNLPDDVII